MLRDTIRYDLGLLKLKPLAGQEAGERNHYISMRHEERDESCAQIYGYPGNAQSRAQTFNLWGTNGPIARSQRHPNTMCGWIDATPGQSGAPVLRIVGDEISTVGVYSGAPNGIPTPHNFMARLGPVEIALIENVTQLCS